VGFEIENFAGTEVLRTRTLYCGTWLESTMFRVRRIFL